MPTTQNSTQETSKARQLATRLASLPHRYLAGKLPPKKLAQELREIANWIDPSGAEQPVPKTTAEERELFEYWKRQVGKPRAQFTRDRQMKIRARLREGYTVADIKQAIQNIANSAFHAGENTNGQEYQDLTLVCRNGSKLEHFRDMGDGSFAEPTKGEARTADEQIAALQREASQALAEGRTDAYNETQQAIRRIRSAGQA